VTPSSPTGKTPMPTASATTAGAVRRWLPLLAIAALMALVFAMGWHKLLSFKTIGTNYDAMRAFIGQNLVAALAIYMLAYIAVVALSLPGWWRCRCPAGSS